jgi:hypothetical protein
VVIFERNKKGNPKPVELAKPIKPTLSAHAVHRFNKTGCRPITSPGKPTITVTERFGLQPVYPAMELESLIRSRLEATETHLNPAVVPQMQREH